MMRHDASLCRSDVAEALMLSVGGGYVEVIAMLLQASADPNRGILGVTPLMMAAASGQLEARALMDGGCEPNFKSYIC